MKRMPTINGMYPINSCYFLRIPFFLIYRFDLAIDIPAEMGDLASYRATLGHKANWSPEPNAKVTLFTAHPVLGVIMSLVAEKDIPAGEEVTIIKDESLYQQWYQP